ncbi:helicase C-terminal domain-containing protein [Cryobacterium sp. Y11]|uniref:helicase C-terminal domain-containing protein n=1 Tax=Cryobacterium sp. Y11 TaxID=2045016 RepID=UPI000CE4337D|nr:helicase C-terminal domain-containing protein [Cryobacterium sp. Y11]
MVDNVELGYAATINRVQGLTVDTSHILVDPQSTSREQLYVAATRGRECNRMYAVVEETLEADGHAPDHLRTSVVGALTPVLACESAERSAQEEIQIA